MGILLTLLTYLIIAVFLGISLSKFLALLKASQTMKTQKIIPSRNSRPGPLLFIKMAGDVFFLTRLLKTNDVLWIGEWVFHCSFLLVVLRHLRYILNPVPGWVWHFQTAGLIAGYILPLSLIYIFFMKIGKEERYFPSYNFFLVILLFFIGITGLLIKTVFRIDIVMVDNFMLGIFTFRPADAPASILFIIHYLLILVLAAYLPSHVFAAPFVIIEARKREEELKVMMHEE